jgi:hypothetical protein
MNNSHLLHKEKMKLSSRTRLVILWQPLNPVLHLMVDTQVVSSTSLRKTLLSMKAKIIYSSLTTVTITAKLMVKTRKGKNKCHKWTSKKCSCKTKKMPYTQNRSY